MQPRFSLFKTRIDIAPNLNEKTMPEILYFNTDSGAYPPPKKSITRTGQTTLTTHSCRSNKDICAFWDHSQKVSESDHSPTDFTKHLIYKLNITQKTIIKSIIIIAISQFKQTSFSKRKCACIMMSPKAARDFPNCCALL